MARDALVKFFSEVSQRPDLKAALDPLSGEELVAAAVKAAAKLNCPFSDEEFREVMRAAAARNVAGGELSEKQLESVAGGRKAGKEQQEYLIIKLTDVLVTGVSMSVAEDAPTVEIVSLQFAKVDLEYKPQKADGSLDAGLHFKYDIKANKVG